MVDVVKKRWVSILLSLALVFALAGETLAAPAPVCKVKGNGTANNPYNLCTANDFNLMRSYPTKYFQQGAHITLTNWTPIPKFTGSFNGKSYNLKLQSFETGGLFTENLGLVRNLVMYVNIRGTYQLGGVAQTNRGTIDNVIVAGETVSARWSVGGIATYNYGTIKAARVSAAIYGINAGGIAAYNYGKIEGSFVSGGVRGGFEVGGLVYKNSGTINNSHTWGKPVEAYRFTGSSFVAWNAETGIITNSTATNDLYIPLSSVADSNNFVGKNNGKITKSWGSGKVHILIYN